MAAKFFIACLLIAKFTQVADAASSGNEKASKSDPQKSGTHNQAHSFLAGPSPTPAEPEVERTIMAIIQISDPLEFHLDRYVDEVQKVFGAAQPPKAVVKAFGIIVKYVLPENKTISEAKAAVAKANTVLNHQVQVTQTDIWVSGKRLALNVVHVNITVPDKVKAAAVQTSAADVAALELAIGGHISVPFSPKMTAKVETRVKTASSSAIGQLAGNLNHPFSDADNIYADGPTSVSPRPLQRVVNAWWHFKEESTIPTPSPSGAYSNVSIVLAVLLILLQAV